MAREPAYDSFRKLGDEKLFDLAQALVHPDALRRTNLIEFSDLTSVSHQIVTEVRSLDSGGWPGYVPKTNSSDDCRGFVFLGFLRRGMPVQHTRTRMMAGDKSIELTRMDDYSESVTLALLLLDTVWRRCMKSERVLIPRPFWLGEGSRGREELPMSGAPPGDLFWQEFLGIRGGNLNPDWELFVSRCELAESVKASRLWRDGRGQGESKWSEERALLAKLCSRLAFSYLSVGWLPQGAEQGTGTGQPGGGDLVLGDGPYKVEFEFQERVLKAREQAKRIQGLRRRASHSFEESAWEAREQEQGHTERQTVYERGIRDRDLRRVASVPETYLGLLDPALDNPDHRARRSRKSERVLSRDDPGGQFAGPFALVSVVTEVWIAALVFAAARLTLDPWPEFAVLGVLALVGVALGVWTLYTQRSPGRGLGPSTSPGMKFKTSVSYLASLAVVVGTVAVIGDAPLSFVLVPVVGLFICLVTGVFPRPVYWLGAFLIALVGLAYLMPGFGGGLIDSAFEPWNWGEALGISGTTPGEGKLLAGLLAVLFAAGLLSLDLAYVTSGWRQETVVLPTWSGSGDWNVYEIRTPPEFSVWQGVIARPSRRNRGWRTRTAIEIGRKAHFWWSDPSDRGHIPRPVPDRPQLLVLELRARMSGTITIIGSFLSFATAAILLGVGLTQWNGGPDLWGNLQGVSGDAITTILLLVPTLLGALLIRPGEEPIAGQLLRVDRILVLLGAIVPASVAAAALLFLGWPESPGFVIDPSAIRSIPGDQFGNLANTQGILLRQEEVDQDQLFWVIWVCLGTISLVAGLTLLLSWLDARKIDRPEPFNRQQGLPVSEPRRRNLDYPAPLPPLDSLWGRIFARRSLLRLSPRRSLFRSRVSTTYSLILPAEGSRVYTPAAPTILMLLPVEEGQSEEGSAVGRDAAWGKLEETIGSLIGKGRQPWGTRAGLATNLLEWDPAASLSFVPPHYLSTDSLSSDERFLTTLLRLQRANSRPNHTKAVGGGGGLVVSQLPQAVSPEGFKSLLRGRSWNPLSKARKALRGVLDAGGSADEAVVASPTVTLLGLDPEQSSAVPVLDLPSRADLSTGLPSEDEERYYGFRRLIRTLDRAGLDFDALLFVDPEALGKEQDELVVRGDGWATRYLSARAAALARGAGRGPGTHVWPSSFEPPFSGEGIFPIWPGDHGERIQLGRRMFLREWSRLRSWGSLRLPRKLLFTRWTRTIPLGVLTSDKRDGRAKRHMNMRSRATPWMEWVGEIPRSLASRPPLPRISTENPWTVLVGELAEVGSTNALRNACEEWIGIYGEENRRLAERVLEAVKEPSLDLERLVREFGHDRKLFKSQIKVELKAKKRPFKVVLMSGNIASGKSWMMHKLRPRLASSKGEEWGAIRVDSAHNFFFANQDALEGDGIDTRTASYHLDPDLGELALAYQDLIQKAFLIEAWDVLQTALEGVSKDQDGVFIEYWPAFSAHVMSVAFLGAFGSGTSSAERKKRIRRLVKASDNWNRHVLPEVLGRVSQVSGGKIRPVEWQMIHLAPGKVSDPGSISELEQRVRLRSRRNEELDGVIIAQTQARLNELYGADMEKSGRRRKKARRADGLINPGTQGGAKPKPSSYPQQWPETRILNLNPGPRPTGKDLKKALDRLIKLL